MKALKIFILRYSTSHFILSKSSAKQYHHIHSVMLYFVYLVYLIYQNLERTKKAKNTLETIDIDSSNIENSSHVELMQQRLNFVDDYNYVNFKEYRERLDLFFKLF